MQAFVYALSFCFFSVPVMGMQNYKFLFVAELNYKFLFVAELCFLFLLWNKQPLLCSLSFG